MFNASVVGGVLPAGARDKEGPISERMRRTPCLCVVPHPTSRLNVIDKLNRGKEPDAYDHKLPESIVVLSDIRPSTSAISDALKGEYSQNK